MTALLPIVYVIIIGIAILKGMNKSNHASEKETAERQNAAVRRYTAKPAAPSRPASAPSRPAAAPVTPRNNRSFADNSFTAEHYHQEGFDFETCFSFKDIPAGADELDYLIRANRRHEKQLEKLLQTNENQN